MPHSEMQKKKNIALLISLILLSLACVAVYWSGRSDSSLDINQNLFKVEDFKSIDRIVLNSAAHKVELKVVDNRWRVNDRYLADRNLVDILFATLQQAIPKRPIAERIQDSVSQELEKDGVRVSLYSDSELRKEFLAGGNLAKNQAYFREVTDPMPYLMVIPGYRVYVSGILEMDESGWRDKYVFGFNWQNFKKLETTYPENSKNNFTVIMKERRPVLEGFSEAVVDTARLHTYLDDVSLLTASQFIANNDTLWKGGPVIKISIEDIAGRVYTVDFFSKITGSDQFPALIQDSDPALFDSKKLQPVLKTRDYFRLK